MIVNHFPIGSRNNKRKDVEIIATNADILNQILSQYYPEKFAGRRNSLNYPVGQFILKLHEMYHDGELILNVDILMGVFSSDWLSDKKTGENARDYTSDLQGFYLFFNGCEFVDDWLERMDALIDQYEKLLPLFEKEGNSRVVESVRSPFSRIGYLSFDKNRAQQIRRFFLPLKDMATNLFDTSEDGETINIHFQRLENLMRKNNPIDRALLKKKKKRLYGDCSKNILCL